jgi:hypothetical protein
VERFMDILAVFKAKIVAFLKLALQEENAPASS